MKGKPAKSGYTMRSKQKAAAEIVQLRTGHCGLNRYLHYFGIKDTPYCECGYGQRLGLTDRLDTETLDWSDCALLEVGLIRLGTRDPGLMVSGTRGIHSICWLQLTRYITPCFGPPFVIRRSHQCQVIHPWLTLRDTKWDLCVYLFHHNETTNQVQK